jgi:hypothetical protein
MKKLTLFLIALMTTSMSAAAIAEQGWITQAKITKIVVTSAGGINVRITPELTGCTSQSGYGARYASVYPSHPGIDKIHATLLTAYVADKTVALYLSDTTCKLVEVELGGR